MAAISESGIAANPTSVTSMPFSEFATWINPLLRALRDLGGSARPQEAVDAVARQQRVSDTVLDQTNQNGESRFRNQVHWARFYLAEAGYIDRSERGVWRLTEKALQTPELTDQQIRDLLTDVQESTAGTSTRTRRRAAPTGQPVAIPAPPKTTFVPIDDTKPAPEADDRDHRAKLLALLKQLPSGGFERLCQRLLREAGFEQVVVTGRSGDGGIDGHGVLGLNAFVSFKVLFQCKRYEGTVSPSHVRDFRGAMQGRADKGIILTTGTFTADARREAVREGVPPLELVDGEKLVALFEQLELGLKPRKSFDIDDGFFDEFRH